MKFSRWLLMNILLPLSPLFVRIYIFMMGNQQSLTNAKIKILDTPELIFFSIFTCITALNINLDGPRKYFEWAVRTFIVIIIGLDLITLGMLYSGNIGSNSTIFSVVVAVIPAIIAPLYKWNHNEEREQ